MRGPKDGYIQTPAPHIRTTESIAKIYWKTSAALIPALIVWLVLWPWHIWRVALLSVGSAVLAECCAKFLFKKKISLEDGNSVLIGLTFIFLVPPELASWKIALTGFFSVFVAKELFGGVGSTLFHPSLIGFAFLWICFPEAMEAGEQTYRTLFNSDSNTIQVLNQSIHLGYLVLLVMFFIGGLFLQIKRVIFWELPWIYLGLSVVLSLAFFQTNFVFSHALLLAAFFLISDPGSTPMSRTGMRIYTILCALGVVVLTPVLSGEQAIYYSVLGMNAWSPWVDRWFKPHGLQQKNRSNSSNPILGT